MFSDSASSTREDFIRNLKKDSMAIKAKIDSNDGKLVVENIVRFDKDECLSSYCQSLGLVRMPGQVEVNFLLRREYQILWDKIKTRLKDDRPETQFVITGTGGIGKSAFRFFVLREWLRDCDESEYQSVVFDECDGFCRVDKSGNTYNFEPDFDLDFNSIFVLKPCSLVDKVKRVSYGLTIVTSSPTLTYRHNHEYSVWDFCGDNFLMKAWTESEISSLWPEYVMCRYRKFSYLKAGERLCIPKWLAYTESQADLQIENYLGQVSPILLRAFLKTSAAHVSNSFVPNELCVFEHVAGRGCMATGFISDHVTRLIHKWANAHSVMDTSCIVELLQNPFSHGLLGGIFKDWMEAALGTAGKVLRFTHENYDLDFTFSEVQSYPWSRRKSGKLQIPQVRIMNKVYYTPDDVNCSMIDGYGIYDDFLLLTQATVAMSHCGVTFSAVQDIITAAQEANRNIRICMVYVVPQAHAALFRPPTRDKLSGFGASTCVGVIRDEDGLMARYMR